MNDVNYPLERIREFFVRRTWLVGERRLITRREYEGLKDRTLDLPGHRSNYLAAFIDGWLKAKE